MTEEERGERERTSRGDGGGFWIRGGGVVLAALGRGWLGVLDDCREVRGG